jgi:hypothetical protein
LRRKANQLFSFETLFGFGTGHTVLSSIQNPLCKSLLDLCKDVQSHENSGGNVGLQLLQTRSHKSGFSLYLFFQKITNLFSSEYAIHTPLKA